MNREKKEERKRESWKQEKRQQQLAREKARKRFRILLLLRFQNDPAGFALAGWLESRECLLPLSVAVAAAATTVETNQSVEGEKTLEQDQRSEKQGPIEKKNLKNISMAVAGRGLEGRPGGN